jgi:hypothetical protein
MSDMRDSMDVPQTHPGPRVGVRSILLGVFILWELFYLPAANLIKLRPVRLPPHSSAPTSLPRVRGRASATGWPGG